MVAMAFDLVRVSQSPHFGVDTYETVVGGNSTDDEIPVPDHLMSLKVGVLLVVYHVIGIAFHVALVTEGMDTWYATHVEENETTPHKWMMLAVSMPLNVVVVAAFAGVRDRMLLFVLVVLVCVVVLCGPVCQYTRRFGRTSYNQVHGTNLTQTTFVVAAAVLTSLLIPIWRALALNMTADNVDALIVINSVMYYGYILVPVVCEFMNRVMMCEDTCVAIIHVAVGVTTSLFFAFQFAPQT
jgi:hypothetical protein